MRAWASPVELMVNNMIRILACHPGHIELPIDIRFGRIPHHSHQHNQMKLNTEEQKEDVRVGLIAEVREKLSNPGIQPGHSGNLSGNYTSH
jgi:hypothetical protein